MSFKDHIARIQDGNDIFKIQLLQRFRKTSHGNFMMSPYVDASKKCYVIHYHNLQPP